LRISDALGAANGVRCIIVESPDRFARDLTVQLAGHDFLKKLGISLVPATAPDFFTEDTPTAVLVRQVLGAIAQFEKTSLVATAKPETVALAKELHGQCMSLRRIAAELAARGHLTAYGKP
jgi:Resolvase, N terminal domain